jgi:hypothetical protein
VILAGCAPLDEQPVLFVKDKDRKRPVQLAFAVRADLLFRANDVVVTIDERDEIPVGHHAVL